MAADRIKETVEQMGDRLKETTTQAKHGVLQTGDRAQEMAHDTGRQTSETTNIMGHRAGEAGQQVGHGGEGFVEKVKHGLGMGTPGDRAEETGHSALRGVSEVGTAMGNRTDEAAQQAGHKGESIGEKITHALGIHK